MYSILVLNRAWLRFISVDIKCLFVPLFSEAISSVVAEQHPVEPKASPDQLITGLPRMILHTSSETLASIKPMRALPSISMESQLHPECSHAY